MNLRKYVTACLISLALTSCVLPEGGGGTNGVGGWFGSPTGGHGAVATGGASSTGGTVGAAGGSGQLLATGGACTGGDTSAGGSTATCNCGTGGNGNCLLGFADCDNSNSCVPLDTPEHCGSCLNDCNTPSTADSTVWQCRDAACAIGACKSGHDNCDGTMSNGCETSLDSDPQHCGACLGSNSKCKYPSCVDGLCSITYPCGNPNLPTDLTAIATIHHNTIFGVPQTLNHNDAVVSFGAVTSVAGRIYRAKFQMALYDSDANGKPKSLLVSPAMTDYSTDADLPANDGLVEQILTKPYVAATPGQSVYWIMLLVEDNYDLDLVVSGQSSPQEVRSAGNTYSWPTGADLSVGFDQVAPPTASPAFFPHMFVRYVPAPPL